MKALLCLLSSCNVSLQFLMKISCGLFLPLSNLLPALRTELIGILAPDFLAVVHGVGGNAENSTLREVVTSKLDTGSWGNDTWETLARRAVDTESLLDDHVEVGKVLDLLVDRDIVGRQGLVELSLQFLDALRVHQHVEEESAGGVGSRVRSSNQLSESFGCKFSATEFVAVLILAFHEASEQVDTVDLASLRGFQTLVDASNGNAGKILNSLDTLGEEWVREIFGVWLDLGNATDSVGDLASAVENFNGRSVGRRGVRRSSHFCNVFAVLEHTKGSAESQITDDVECDVVEPVQAVHPVEAAVYLFAELVPLLNKHLQIVVHVLLELTNALRTECVRDSLALASVLSTVPGVEKTALDRHKSIVVVTTQRSAMINSHRFE